MKRREFLKLSLGTAAVAAWSWRASAEASVKEIRIGYQKNGVLVVAREQAALERHVDPQGIAVKWVEFSSGPPMMEAMIPGPSPGVLYQPSARPRKPASKAPAASI